MQRIILFLVFSLMLAISCQPSKKEKEKIVIGTKNNQESHYDLGKRIFNGKGKCYTCHKIDQKSIGPGITEIMKIYTAQDGDLMGFLKQKRNR